MSVSESLVDSNDQGMLPELDSSGVRTVCFSKGFDIRFAVGEEFNSIVDLREKAVNFGKDHNVMITTYKSSLKEGKIS